MKITMYELLGLVKDGKIPKKIKYNNDIWEYIEEKENYKKSNGASLNWDYVALYCLKEPVEILEEEKKIPEKLETYKENDDEDYFANILKVSKNGECEIDEATSVIVDKVNEIIDYLKSKGDE